MLQKIWNWGCYKKELRYFYVKIILCEMFQLNDKKCGVCFKRHAYTTKTFRNTRNAPNNSRIE